MNADCRDIFIAADAPHLKLELMYEAKVSAHC
jgi:hypothetical protein